MTIDLTPELFESVPCRTCKQPAGSPCIIKRGPRDRTHHIDRQDSAIGKQLTERKIRERKDTK